jgi:hypothetical protein
MAKTTTVTREETADGQTEEAHKKNDKNNNKQ